ncbi:uncharacterized protein LOC143378624 [Andrena cerasifolii]|uniref:uncharacterized protein LOC143378624 n=1 Tax=Andrena cerasifolii TaxID=2819439 RepID=UPI0040377041
MEQPCTVVLFIEDGFIAAVPTMWIQSGSCYWPPYSQKHIPNLLKKCDVAADCWPTFKIKVFKDSTFDNYLKARKKAKVAKETSDLQSEAESGKRKRISKEFSSSEESLHESLLSPPPKLGRTSTVLYDTLVFDHSDYRVQEELEIPRIGGTNESSSS